jgi:hypothetical protein
MIMIANEILLCITLVIFKMLPRQLLSMLKLWSVGHRPPDVKRMSRMVWVAMPNRRKCLRMHALKLPR